MPATLSPDLLEKMDAYWRAANYLTVGQIYLQDNPLLEMPLKIEHVKPRLLGHWGMKDGKYRTITCGIQKLVGMPTGSQRASFSLAVADDAGDD
jgi:phosphoketolase